MYSVGEKIIYGENGVCTVVKIAPLEMSGASKDKLYYYLTPLVGSGTYFAPVDTNAFMRPIISRDEAESFIDSIPGIPPAICNDSRFNHVDAFYRELFKLHTNEALVSVIKGLAFRMSQKKTRSSRAEATMKRAKDILHGELSVALEMDFRDVEGYISNRIGKL
ncbi:MAG: CarD family transcriptional regulator [Oscillospiraceae bacterium]|nr:CarD family transcriptional regulator [Oscillospiraceae bacterium]